MTEILSEEEAKKLDSYHNYGNGDYKYEDKEWIEHLIRDGEEIASGIYVFSYENGDYKYQDKEWTWHLIRNGEEIATGNKVYSYDNGDYIYQDENGKIHKFNKNGEPID